MNSASKLLRPEYCLADFDFDLSTDLIAQFPAPRRSASRLLRVADASCTHHHFSALPGMLSAGDLLVINDTRVLKARLFGTKSTGGAVEVLVERILTETEALVMLRASKTPREGTRIDFPGQVSATVSGRDAEFFRLSFQGTPSITAFLDKHGHLPLPPYINHADDDQDAERYQTVYAREPGAVAAPTAGLHFDEELLASLVDKGVTIAPITLHVGAGTFQPVRSENLSEHRMHSERFAIPASTAAAVEKARASGARVIAVGTTSLRALESAAIGDGVVRTGEGETRLFITPGYRFRIVDRLLTNFHLPRSTLLMLVSAFAGFEAIRRAYALAIAERYRFFSYGDAMLLDRASPNANDSD